MRTRRIGLSSKVLVGANTVLALIVALQLAYPVRSVGTTIETETDGSSQLPEFGDTTVNAPPIANLPDMLERPLFFADRRMPAPRAEKPAPPPTPLRLKLEGVALSGGARIAVLRNLANNQLLQLEEGGTHDGWTLDSLTSTSASFSRGEQMTALPLDPGIGGRR